LYSHQQQIAGGGGGRGRDEDWTEGRQISA